MTREGFCGEGLHEHLAPDEIEEEPLADARADARVTLLAALAWELWVAEIKNEAAGS